MYTLLIYRTGSEMDYPDKAKHKHWTGGLSATERSESTIWMLERRQIRSGSKTVAMDVRGFLCVSLCSSRVQRYDSLGRRCACACSEAGFSCQNGDSVWDVYYRRAEMYYAFFGVQNDSMQRIFINKCFLFTVESVCRVKHSTTKSRKVEKFSLIKKRLKRRCASDWDNSQKSSMLRVSTHL
jgi:hypothetical protein